MMRRFNGGLIEYGFKVGSAQKALAAAERLSSDRQPFAYVLIGVDWAG